MMRNRFGPYLGTIALVSLAVVTPTAQKSAPAARSASTWTPPRTPDGHPDLQGTWTNGTLTPFERPAAQANKPFLTEEEVAAIERQSAERRANPAARRAGDVGTDNEAFVDTGYRVTSTRQTSLVIEPPDGRIPFLPAAEVKRDFNLNNTDDYETMSPWDRCITRSPSGLFPAGYNNGYQIVQSSGYVVILSEMIHEARIIPTDGSGHPNARVRSWLGDSRGHWEGTTLVVDTTNFSSQGWFSTHAGSGRLRGTPMTEALHLVEKFTRVSADTIIYSMTIEDPGVYWRPWTVQVPFTRDDTYQIFEYACHEGNQAPELMLKGARALEHQTSGVAAPGEKK
jgi:hypothetical protein